MTATLTTADAVVSRVRVGAYTIPTDAPQSDGTIAWDATTIIVVEVTGGEQRGVGCAYADASRACGCCATACPRAWRSRRASTATRSSTPPHARKRAPSTSCRRRHARIERLLFDGVLEPMGGRLVPDRGRPGLGLQLRRADAECYAV